MAEQEKILIVDDNKNNRDLYKICLEIENYEIYLAENGEEGLRLTKKINPDIILLDIMMPGINGYQLLEILKSDLSCRDIPVLIITVNSSPEDIMKALKMGANDYLKKPFDIEELLVRTNKLLQLKQSQDLFKKKTVRLNQYQQLLEDEVDKWYHKVESLKQELINLHNLR